MGAKIGVVLIYGQQSQFSKVRREFDAGHVNLDPPMTCADWPVPGNLALLHSQTAYTRKPLHRDRLARTLGSRLVSNAHYLKEGGFYKKYEMWLNLNHRRYYNGNRVLA